MIKDVFSCDQRLYVTINTTDYNEDGRAGVIVSDYNSLHELGWDEDGVKDLKVGDIFSQIHGAYIIRIA